MSSASDISSLLVTPRGDDFDAGAAGEELVFLKCDMCENLKELKHRCLECSSNMCADCSDHHKKMKISSDHEMIDYKRYIVPPTTPPPSKMHCQQHRKEPLQFYCKLCCKPLCLNCKLTKHEGHKTTDIQEEIREQRTSLPVKLIQIRTSFLPILKKQLKETEDYEKEFSFNIRETMEGIDKRTKAIKDEVDKTGNRITGRLKHKEKKEYDRIRDRKRALSDCVRIASVALTNGENITKSGDDFEVIELYASLMRMFQELDDLTKRKLPKNKVYFQDGSMGRGGMDAVMGNFSEIAPKPKRAVHPKPRPKPKTPHFASMEIIPDISPHKISDFQCQFTPGNRVSAIAPVGDGDAWICFGWTTNEIYLYSKSGVRKGRIVLKGPVDDLAVDDHGNIIVSTFSGSSVRLVDKKQHEKNDFIAVTLKTRGLAVTSTGEIILSVVDQCTAMPPPSKNALIKYSSKGVKLNTMEGDKRKKIPIHPYRVCENIDGSVCVTDWVTDKEGRVVIFSHDGKVRMVYYGNKPDHKSFFPYGICTDKFGHILIGDTLNKEVHMLDIQGHFLRILLTTAGLNWEKPYSLAVDGLGHLWVGNERKQIKVFEYFQKKL